MDSYNKWLAQFRKGLLELCILMILRKKKACYGFQFFEVFTKARLDVNEGTLYPLLNRMEKNGWLLSRWETPVNGGHPRRYYRLSDEGSRQIPLMLKAYQSYSSAINLWEHEDDQ